MSDYDLNKTVRWTMYTAGVIFLFLGILSILHPFIILVSTAVFMGVGMILAGINNLVPYLTMRNNPLRPKWLLPLGIVDMAFGIVFLSHIGLAIFALTSIIGAWLLAAAATRFYIAYKLKTVGTVKWWATLATAALMVLLSLILLFVPELAELWTALLVGGSILAAGCLMIAEGRVIYR